MSESTYEIETSLTLDYRKSAWGIERIVLDSIANHLPDDSNGTITSVRLKQDGQFVDLKEADKEKQVEEAVFEDNGSGYDAGLLSVLFSPKAADSLSVGQFGEGLKMVAAAALRHGLDVEYRSRNWRAIPYTKPENIGGHSINRLCFRVTENGDNLEGSRTVFTKPSEALIAEIFELPGKVLALNDSYRELHNEKDNVDYTLTQFKGYETYTVPLWKPCAVRKSSRYKSRIIEMTDGSTSFFIKGVRIQGSNSLFSYDLGLSNISPDRIFADKESVLDEIEALLKGCSNIEVIEKVLREAHRIPDRYCDEFEAFRDRKSAQTLGQNMGLGRPMLTDYFRGRNETNLNTLLGEGKVDIEAGKYLEYLKSYADNMPQNHWVVTFRKLFGEDAVIASHDTNINSDAEIMGYRPIKLNYSVADYLSANGILSADKIENTQEYRWIHDEDLTDSEAEMLRRVREINQVVLGEERDIDVRVYSGLFLKSGREVESSNGVHVTEQDGTKYIGVKRSRLGTLKDFTTTYIHELGHTETGAGDADRRFTEFFVKALSKLSIHYMNQGKSV
jgi:hypothetical protein